MEKDSIATSFGSLCAALVSAERKVRLLFDAGQNRFQSKAVLRSLSEQQLRDAGIDPSLILESWQLEVEGRLIRTLMSLR